MKLSESSFKYDQSGDSQNVSKEEVGEMKECNQSPSHYNKISYKEIRSIFLAKFKAGVLDKENSLKNKWLYPSTVYKH